MCTGRSRRVCRARNIRESCCSLRGGCSREHKGVEIFGYRREVERANMGLRVALVALDV